MIRWDETTGTACAATGQTSLRWAGSTTATLWSPALLATDTATGGTGIPGHWFAPWTVSTSTSTTITLHPPWWLPPRAPGPVVPPPRRPRPRPPSAEARAEALLLTYLDPEQQAAYAQDRTFEVVVGARRYRLRRGGHVQALDPQTRQGLRGYCLVPRGPEVVPWPDALLAQLLLLTSNEAEFLRRAHVHPR